MIKPVLQDPYLPINGDDLSQLEHEIGARLPEDYRSFLLRSNGGNFPFDVIILLRDPRCYASVRHLHGVHTGEVYDVGDTYETLRFTLPPGFLPIGDDAGGNQICIVVAERDVGSIWWVDHEIQPGDGWPPKNAQRLADSFNQFMDALQYPPPEDVGWTEDIPAFMAAERGEAEKLNALLSAGFDLELRNDRGQTLLICAASARQSHVVRLLLQRGATIDARDLEQRTALFWAAHRFSLDSAKLLVAAGADLEAADENGDTPLLVGVCWGDRVSRFLIEQGASVNARNNQGETPLGLCENFPELRSPLLRRGAIV